MLADWGIPKTICDAAQYHENPAASGLEERSAGRELAQIIHAASRIADVCVAATDHQAAASAAELVASCDAVGIDARALVALFEKVFAQWADWGGMLEISTQKPPNLADLIEAGRSLPAPNAGQPEATSESTNSDAAAESDSVEPFESEETLEATARRRRRSSATSARMATDCASWWPITIRRRSNSSSDSWSSRGTRCGARRRARGFAEFLRVGAAAGHHRCRSARLRRDGAVRRLRQTAPGRQAYIIMLTPPDDEETLLRLFEAGVDDFVTKPFAARPLFARIRASLRVVSLQNKVNVDRDEIHRVHAELAVAHRRLEQDALTDVLTGLPNRRYLIDRLAHDWTAARRGGTPLACMVVDIDHFKAVNDTFGHDVGDEVLRSVANVLQRHVRGTDVVCRFGGEEFVVISATDFDSALQFAERLRRAIEEELPRPLSPFGRPVTVSIGVDVRSPQTRSPEALLKAADEGLFLAKRSGLQLRRQHERQGPNRFARGRDRGRARSGDSTPPAKTRPQTGPMEMRPRIADNESGRRTRPLPFRPLRAPAITSPAATGWLS